MYLLASVNNEFTDPTALSNWITKYAAFNSISGVALNIVFYGGVALTLIFGIINGIKYATSGGDKFASQAAKQGVTNAVIGFIIVVGFKVIVSVIINLLGGDAANLPNSTPEF